MLGTKRSFEGVEKRKHVALTIPQKVEIIHELDCGASVNYLAQNFGISSRTVYDIKNNKNKILKFYANSDSNEGILERKTIRAAKFEELDDVLYEWFKEKRSEGAQITGPLLCEKAKELHNALKVAEACSFSSGWLTSFKKRHGIRCIKVCGEKLSTDHQVADEFMDQLTTIVKNECPSPEQINDTEETGFSWDCLPRITLSSSESDTSGFNEVKDIATVPICSSGAGTSLKTGSLIIEGKTKRILEIKDDSENVLMVSKDKITAGDGAKADDMEGKAVISTATTARIFQYLNEVGVKTHFVRQHDEKSIIVKKCDMIPIEWVSRRHATGSFLKRNPGVKEGYRFAPVKLETFYKDDANHDPQWSDEQLICNELVVGGIKISKAEVEIMHKTTACIFEVLEKAWASLNCSLIDMKVEYGVTQKGELVLADVIDSDSWRLWPSGDKRLMVDKQVYRNLKEKATQEDLEKIKRNFEWVAEQVKEFLPPTKVQVVILMGSPSDKAFCEEIQQSLKKFGVPTCLRITSAHKGPDDTLKIIAEYEGSGQPTIFIAVAGRSNGLGPVTSGNSVYPVINCPPITAEWGQEDIWSSLRLPSGLGCTTIISKDGAALAAAQMIALTDHVIWSKLKAAQLNRWIVLKQQDAIISAQ